MRLINRMIKIIDKLNDVIGKIGSWTVLILMLIVVFEVISRRIFSSPTIWSYEVTTMLFGTYFMILAAYGVLHKSHVIVDTLYEKFSVRNRAILEIASYLLLYFPFVISILFYSLRFVDSSWAIRETSPTLFAGPVYLFKTMIPIAFGLLLLQGISEVLKQVVILTKKDDKSTIANPIEIDDTNRDMPKEGSL